jgi:hypothetical protein
MNPQIIMTVIHLTKTNTTTTTIIIIIIIIITTILIISSARSHCEPHLYVEILILKMENIMLK